MQHQNLSKKYQKKTQLEHILDLPDTYIGSVDPSDIDLWVFNNEAEKICKKTITIANGLYKIFDEIIVNACDHHIRLKDDKELDQVTMIKVNIDKESGNISVYNNGQGIPIAKHEVHNVYIPELIFGHFLTSENYDKDQKKIVGGKNGWGAKLSCVYSTEFIIETVDAITRKKYVQIFKNNMKEHDSPKITTCSAKPYTKITFKPDLSKFSMTELDDDIISLMKRRVYDLTACTDRSVTIYFNDKKLDYKSFEKYVELYLGGENKKVYEYVNDRWEVIVAMSEDEEFEQISFVNGIYTYKGGKHVEHVATHIAGKLQKHMANKGRNKVILKTEHIKKNMFLFLRCSIENPSFSSQTKEYLTTPSKNFGSKFSISDKFIEKLSKIGIVERSIALSKYKNDLGLVKKENKKTKHLRIPQLDDANWAGTNRSSECTLILTEGLSAKATAISGLSVVGRDKYGVYPLRGKILNVREVGVDKLIKNREINDIKTILGLQQYEYETDTSGKKISPKKTKKVYKDVSELRYGHIMALCDSDVDGAHIKGLLINFIGTFWPELLNIPGFLISIATPIVKVTKGKTIISFYNLTDYNKWREETDTKGWKIKYYKGLGTSTREEAKEYFQDIEANSIKYYVNDDKCIETVKFAFSKENADERKEWLKNYDKNAIIEHSEKNVNYSDFINKELIHFSIYDCVRSIPSVCDGLKPSQRKVLFGCIKRNLKNEIKVAQLSGYVSEHAAYHHGEMSLQKTIISMAHNFVGSNNVNLLKPIGQFGTRVTNGDDAASPRYIFTCLNDITFNLFNKLDEPLYNYLDDDGLAIEPEWYLPILPNILINGALGIGTGYSTYVPCFNPLDIIDNIYNIMENKEIKEMIPWYRGFKGNITKEGNGLYICRGVYKFRTADSTVEIEELPIGVWTENYHEKLDNLIIDKTISDDKKKTKQCITSYKPEDGHDDIKIHLTIKFPKKIFDSYKNDIDKFEKDFELVKNIRTSNMHLFNTHGKINKYETVDDILREYYEIRLQYYLKRKTYWLIRLRKQLDIIEAKIKFIEYVRDQKIDIRKSEEEVIKLLEEFNFPKFSANDLKGKLDIEQDEIEQVEKGFNYNYLLTMPIRTLTIKVLEKMRKEHEEKLAEYKTLEKKNEKDLWKEDLEDIKKKYLEDLKEHLEKQLETTTDKKKKLIIKKKIKKI